MSPEESRNRSTKREAELVRQIDDLKRQVRERDEFLSIVGHELRNPVSPLYMQIAVMSERAATAAGSLVDKAWVVAELDKLTGRLDYFVGCLNRLLDVSRLGEGTMDLRAEPCDLVEVVRTTVDSFAEIRRLNISVVQDGVASLPGTWDRMRLEQVAGNLVSNAIRYGLGRPITVTVDTDEQDRARLRVQDRGIGIAANELPSIFDRFRRVGNTRRASGFGVGLWVVAELVRAMHGTITVTSELGQGSVFTVSLPREMSHD